jgi:hypothetical protein
MDDNRGEINATTPNAIPRHIEYAAVFSIVNPKIVMTVEPLTFVMLL